MDRQIEKKKWPVKKIVGVAIAGLFVVVVTYNLLLGDHSSKLNVTSDRVTISTVELKPFQEFIPITGTVIPIQTVYIDALEGGRVEEIYLEAGKIVEEGEKILSLENRNLRLDIMSQESSLLDQRNELRNTRLKMEQQRLELSTRLTDLDHQISRTKRIYEQNKILLENKIISQQEYDESEEEYLYNCKKKELAIQSARQDSMMMSIQIEQLEASLKRLQANLDIVMQRLDNLLIKAPVSGQLTSLNAEYTGEIKNAGDRIGQIDILDGYKIRAGIDEHYLPRIYPELNGEFEFAGKTFELQIVKIFPEIANGRFDVDFEFTQDSPSQIRRGQTVHIRLELGDLADAVVLPVGGFYQKTGGQWVYVVNSSNNMAEKRGIELGRKNTEVYEVLAGLKPGDRVITSSYDNFGDVDKLVLK